MGIECHLLIGGLVDTCSSCLFVGGFDRGNQETCDHK